MFVEGIYHNETSDVVPSRQLNSCAELIFQVLGDLLSVNPKLHALGDAVEGAARSFEGKCFAHHLPIMGRLTDVNSEFICPRQGAVCGSIGVDKDIDSRA